MTGVALLLHEKVTYRRVGASDGYVGVRVGEAAAPGPFTYGGSSSSVGGWEQIGHGRYVRHSAEQAVEAREANFSAQKEGGMGEAEMHEAVAEARTMPGKGNGLEIGGTRAGANHFDDADADPFEWLEGPEEEFDKWGGPGGAQAQERMRGEEIEGLWQDEEEDVTEQWYRRAFEVARDQTEDPRIEELEQYEARDMNTSGKGVPLPTERLLREWGEEQKRERDAREARWKGLTEMYNRRARGGGLGRGKRRNKQKSRIMGWQP